MDENSADFILERVLTNVSDIGTPGHIISSFPSMSRHMVYERILFLPEDFLVAIEKTVIAEDPENGRSRLYSTGKQFGHVFASLFDPDMSDIKKSIYVVFRYLETLYAEKVEIRNIDLSNRTIHIYAKNLVVTNRDGMGYILPIGGCAGIWAYLFNDYTLECSHRKLSDTEVEVVMGPADALRSAGLEIITSDDRPKSIDWDMYKIYNTPKNVVPYDYFSMEKFMKSGVIAYKRGDMEIKKARLVSIELSFLYSIEDRFSANEVQGSAYSTFSALADASGSMKDPHGFIAKFFTALGFGRVNTIVAKDRIIFNFSGYPWSSESYENSGFNFIKGAILGFLDRSTGKKNIIGATSHTVIDNSFILTIEIPSN